MLHLFAMFMLLFAPKRRKPQAFISPEVRLKRYLDHTYL